MTSTTLEATTNHAETWIRDARHHLRRAREYAADSATMQITAKRQWELLTYAEMHAGLAGSYAESVSRRAGDEEARELAESARELQRTCAAMVEEVLATIRTPRR